MKALKRYLPTALVAGAIIYFAVHALSGDQGVIAWTGVKRSIAALETELIELQAQRDALADRARRLRRETLDRDFLDERARALLNVAAPLDLIVPAATLPREALDGAEITA